MTKLTSDITRIDHQTWSRNADDLYGEYRSLLILRQVLSDDRTRGREALRVARLLHHLYGGRDDLPLLHFRDIAWGVANTLRDLCDEHSRQRDNPIF